MQRAPLGALIHARCLMSIVGARKHRAQPGYAYEIAPYSRPSLSRPGIPCPWRVCHQPPSAPTFQYSPHTYTHAKKDTPLTFPFAVDSSSVALLCASPRGSLRSNAFPLFQRSVSMFLRSGTAVQLHASQCHHHPSWQTITPRINTGTSIDATPGPAQQLLRKAYGAIKIII